MSSIEFTETSRNALRTMIRKENARVGSLTLATDNIAKAIGMSSSWIRKFLADNEAVKEPRLTLHFKIVAAFYDRVCNRVEQEQQNELVEIARLRREIDAVTASFIQLAGASNGANAAAKDAELVETSKQ